VDPDISPKQLAETISLNQGNPGFVRFTDEEGVDQTWTCAEYAALIEQQMEVLH